MSEQRNIGKKQVISGFVPDVSKIAVVRANALGDFIFVLPALEALRQAYPHAEIVLLAKDWHAAFLHGRSGPVQRVQVIPPCRGVSTEAEGEEDPLVLESFFSEMAREHFDLALQLHGGGHYSNPFTLRLGARMTVGLKTPDAEPLDRWLPYVYFQHEVIRYLEVVSLVGANTVGFEPHITLNAQDMAESNRVLAEGRKSLVALHPGASDPRRRWPIEKFAAVGDALSAAGVQVVITGTADERELAAAVRNTMHTRVQDLSGQLSLGGLAGLLSRCRLVVANDTGPLHLAAAVGTATVGIYWCFNMINASVLTRRRHYPFISWQLLCPVCGCNYAHAHCAHESSMVQEVPVDAVIAAAQELLADAFCA
ncbi:glycosyltransferase family 9 protein [Ktedonosporobacter rubrisoli]|uniref:Glycosyltransferase family 9 protein n=1 Tax=Ktedonosporobacter rubrisoli TaxID=2509675 RepID=A0A4P6JT19_KTERU|nr:glycosyltransferase family 9 protein [Ktedonosporobacter rubrisoli]QBD78707.1 glycosyltransferase family 9 protein [Ktedonosporobacter rubrisoli]